MNIQDVNFLNVENIMDNQQMINDDDDWYHNSINKYGELIMFETEDVIEQLELLNKDVLLALGHNSNDESILILYDLPSKLKVLPEDEGGLIKSYDMRIISGLFPAKRTVQITSSEKSNLIYASEEAVNGVHLYRLEEEEQRLADFGILESSITCPSLSVWNNLLSMAGNSNDLSAVIDVESKQIIHSYNWPNGSSTHSLKNLFLSNNKYCLLCQETGDIHINDIRQKNSAIIIKNIYNCDGISWTLNSTDENFVGEISSQTHFLLYDLRNYYKIRNDGTLNIPIIKSDNMQLKFNWENSNIFSVNGYDGNIYVYQINKQDVVEEIFLHDGHAHMENCDRNTITTCSLWYNNGVENIIISSADNCSINLWEFKL